MANFKAKSAIAKPGYLSLLSLMFSETNHQLGSVVLASPWSTLLCMVPVPWLPSLPATRFCSLHRDCNHRPQRISDANLIQYQGRANLTRDQWLHLWVR